MGQERPPEPTKDAPKPAIRPQERWGSKKSPERLEEVNKKVNKYRENISLVDKKVTENHTQLTEKHRNLKEAQEREEENEKSDILSAFTAPKLSFLAGDIPIWEPKKLRIPEVSTFVYTRMQAENDLQRTKENFSKSLWERYESQMISVRDTWTLDALDPEWKKMVHTEIICQTLKPEEVSKNYLEQAQKEILGPSFQWPISPEQEVLLRDRALQLQAATIQSEYQKALDADRKMNPPGTTSQEYLKKFSPLNKQLLH